METVALVARAGRACVRVDAGGFVKPSGFESHAVCELLVIPVIRRFLGVLRCALCVWLEDTSSFTMGDVPTLSFFFNGLLNNSSIWSLLL